MTYQQWFYSWLQRVDRMKSEEQKLSELHARLRTTRSPQYLKLILFSIANAYKTRKLYDDALKIYTDMINTDLDDVVTKVSVYSMYLYDIGDLSRALLWAEDAILSAKKVKRFLALALGTRGRIALALNDYALLEKTLLEQIHLDRSVYTVDSHREWDFFDRADKSRLSRNIVDTIERGRR